MLKTITMLSLALLSACAPNSPPIAQQAPISMPGPAIHLTPIAARSDFTPVLAQPVGTNGVSHPGLIVR